MAEEEEEPAVVRRAREGAAEEAEEAEGEEEACDIHAWLPVMRVGLPFILQADWSLVASRQAVHTDSAWNRALRDAALDALVNAVQSDTYLAERVPLWLPLPERCHDAFWRPLFGVADRLGGVALLRAEDGSLVAPQDALLREMPPLDLGPSAPLATYHPTVGLAEGGRAPTDVSTESEPFWSAAAVRAATAQETARRIFVCGNP